MSDSPVSALAPASAPVPAPPSPPPSPCSLYQLRRKERDAAYAASDVSRAPAPTPMSDSPVSALAPAPPPVSNSPVSALAPTPAPVSNAPARTASEPHLSTAARLAPLLRETSLLLAEYENERSVQLLPSGAVDRRQAVAARALDAAIAALSSTLGASPSVLRAGPDVTPVSDPPAAVSDSPAAEPAPAPDPLACLYMNHLRITVYGGSTRTVTTHIDYYHPDSIRQMWAAVLSVGGPTDRRLYTVIVDGSKWKAKSDPLEDREDLYTDGRIMDATSRIHPCQIVSFFIYRALAPRPRQASRTRPPQTRPAMSRMRRIVTHRLRLSPNPLPPPLQPLLPTLRRQMRRPKTRCRKSTPISRVSCCNNSAQWMHCTLMRIRCETQT